MSGRIDPEFVPLDVAAVRDWLRSIVGQPIVEDSKPWERPPPSGYHSPASIRNRVANILGVSEWWIDVTFCRPSHTLVVVPNEFAPPWFDHAFRSGFRREFEVP